MVVMKKGKVACSVYSTKKKKKKPIHLLYSCPISPAAVKCAGCAYISGVWRGTAVHPLKQTAVS